MARQRNTQRREARQQAFLAALGDTGMRGFHLHLNSFGSLPHQ